MYVPQMPLRTQAGDRREKDHWVVIKKRDTRNVNDKNGGQISKDSLVPEKQPTIRRSWRKNRGVSFNYPRGRYFSYIADRIKHRREQRETDDPVDGGKREYL